MISSHKHLMIMVTVLSGIVFFVVDDTPSSTAVAQASAPAPVVHTSPVPPAPISGKPSETIEYLEITEGCGNGSAAPCIPAYSGPGVEYEKIYELERGMLLKIKGTVEQDGQLWYLVHFDEWLRYPGRTPKEWYIPAVAGRVIRAGKTEVLESRPATNKRIIVDLSEHMVHAYDGDMHFMTTKIATGEDVTPTPTGTFTVYKKTPSRYMQGPIPGVTGVPFDLPGVPWNLYFTKDGAVIHGTYWHDRYGTEQSSGCINLPPELARILYDWADLGTAVIIQD